MSLQQLDYIGGIKNKPCIDLRDISGIKFDGSDCSAAFMDYFQNHAPAGSKDVLVPGILYLGALDADLFGSACSGVHFIGVNGGGFSGNPYFATTSVPIPTTRLGIKGVLAASSAAVSYTTPIYPGQSEFTLSGSPFALNTFAMLSNFPEHSTDAFTMSPDGKQRWYNVGSIGTTNVHQDPLNLRQFRRREPVHFRSSTSTFAPVAYDYSRFYGTANKLQFQPYSPVISVWFDNITLIDMFLDVDLSYDFKWTGGKLYRSTLSITKSLHANVSGTFLNAQNTDTCIACGGSTRFYSITDTVINGGLINTDNSGLRAGYSTNGTIDVVLSGHRTPTSSDTVYAGALGQGFYGVIMDCEYNEAPDGYPSTPALDIDLTVNDSGPNFGVFVTCNPFAATSAAYPVSSGHRIKLLSSAPATPQALYLSGCENVQVDVRTPNAGIRLDGTRNVTITGQYTAQYSGLSTDPLNVAPQRRNYNTKWTSVLISPKLTAEATTLFQNFDSPCLESIVFDFSAVSSVTSPGFQLLNLFGNIFLGNIVVLRDSGQTPACYGAAFDSGCTVQLSGDFPIPRVGVWPPIRTRVQSIQWDSSGQYQPPPAADPKYYGTVALFKNPSPSGQKLYALRICNQNSAGNPEWQELPMITATF